MKNSLQLTALCLFLELLVGQAQTLQMPGTPYEFPVVPGTEAWKNLPNHDAMLKATEIPAKVLSAMKTEDLVATALNYPLLSDAFAFDNPIDGVKKVASRSAIFQELFSRADAAEKCVAAYLEQNHADLRADWTLEQKGAFSLKFLLFESLIAQPEIMEKMSARQNLLLLEKLGQNHEAMKASPEVYGSMSRAVPAFVAGKILVGAKADSPELKNGEVSRFVSGRFAHPDPAVVEAVFSANHEFLTNQK